MPGQWSNRAKERLAAAGASPGFTLIEVLIVVVIVGILAAVVVPRFSNASVQAKENTLKTDLRYLRTQIVVYKAQHNDVPPGYPNGDITAQPTADAFVKQMTMYTDEHGQPNAGLSATYRLGPYMQRMAANPMNGQDTVYIVPVGQTMPPAGMPDNSTGWIYNPRTQEIAPNSSGMDSDGKRYIDY